MDGWFFLVVERLVEICDNKWCNITIVFCNLLSYTVWFWKYKLRIMNDSSIAIGYVHVMDF